MAEFPESPPETKPDSDANSESTNETDQTLKSAAVESVQPNSGNQASSVVIDSTKPNTQEVPQNTSSSNGSKLWLLVIAVLIIIGVVAYYLLKPTNSKTPTVTKHDISLVNYGLSDGNIDQTYPLGSSNTSVMWQINAQLFEGLVRFQNQTKVVPLLATNWYNLNDTTWIFNLHRGIKFNDGRSFTAQDVKNSLDYAVAHQNDPNPASVLSFASTIKEVDVTSNYQVKIITNVPDPTLLNRLAQLFVFDTKATLGNPDAGTGPYIIKPGTKSTPTSIDLVATNNYWGGHVYTRAIHIGIVLDASKLASDTAKGQFDIAGDLPESKVSTIHSNSVLAVPDLGISFLGINTENTNSPLSNLAVRQSISYALNIPAILKASDTRGQQASQLIPTTIPGHDPSISITPYNPSKSKQLLASVKNVATPLTLTYISGDDAKASEIAKELDAVGFNIKLSKQPDINTEINIAFSGQTDLFYLSYTSNLLDGLDILNSIVIGNNDYNSTTLNNLASQAGSTINPSLRINLLQQMSRQVAKDIPDLPLFTQTRDYVLMKPYKLQVDLPATEAGLYFWQVYQ